MSIVDLASYFITLLAIALAPGPMLLLLMARAGSNDIRGAVGFAFGTALGSITIIAAVCIGLNAWFSEMPAALSVSKYLMLAYIAWIAWDIWRGGFDMSASTRPQRSGCGFAICMGYTTCILSPYMLVLFPLVLPEIIDITEFSTAEFALISIVTFAAEATAAALIIGLGAQLRRLVRCENSVRLLNRSLATLLMGGGGWMALA